MKERHGRSPAAPEGLGVVSFQNYAEATYNFAGDLGKMALPALTAGVPGPDPDEALAEYPRLVSTTVVRNGAHSVRSAGLHEYPLRAACPPAGREEAGHAEHAA
ncbi:MAG TPA: hypothetical protein VMK12_00220 [Anaeromyxobacteraceae bacterium]|nr:hypothetical protein [Anaeromyxobacteraceae bacterium]